ncbi:hypothetical protein FMUND_11896 [Fusarium mundagurra]|uniref:Heterokaryon incompatibility domain-containing protein n=1 Tax=Fusarium mundagurra TaxID=1567541 RepID=A0A8H5Y4S5_9HYPO|nr:hypothetical protein FMUND_11896 [Fusarium mundagurra]
MAESLRERSGALGGLLRASPRTAGLATLHDIPDSPPRRLPQDELIPRLGDFFALEIRREASFVESPDLTLLTGQDYRNRVSVSEILDNDDWMAAWRASLYVQKCRICNNMDPRGHPHSRVFRSNAGASMKLISVLDLKDFHDQMDNLRRNGIETCGYCDALRRAATVVLRSRGWLGSLQDLQLSSLTLVEGQPALLSMDIWEEGRNKSVGVEIFKLNGPNDVPGLGALGRASCISRNAAADAGMSFVAACLEECEETHMCRLSEACLPKRVLKIEKHNSDGEDRGRFSIRLYIPKEDEIGAYAALSHRWGDEKILVTKKGNMSTMQRGIDWKDLPRTFQDAIQVTHHLGLQYLWVDSLCIIQDDDVDWKTEAPKMGDIYYRAFITIAAVSSVSGGQSFLQNRPVVYDPVPVKFYGPRKASLGRRMMSKVGIRRPHQLFAKLTWQSSSAEPVVGGWSRTDMWNYRVPGPLSMRGWTLQERLMATRIAHFTDEGIIWECMRASKWEDGRSPLPSLIGRWCEFLPGRMASRPTPGMNYPQNCGEKEFSYIQEANRTQLYAEAIKMRSNLQVWWHQILSEYSRRSFTLRKDILYALSGIAERMYNFIQAPYLAGFWADRFLESLCWRPSTLFSSGLRVPPLPQEDSVPGMPSWSCLSICHPIEFAVMDHPGIFDWRCSFLRCDFAPLYNLTRKDFSALRGCKVVLEGLVMEMDLVYPKLWEAASAISGSLKSITGDRAVLVSDAPLIEDTAVNAAGERIRTVFSVLALRNFT